MKIITCFFGVCSFLLIISCSKYETINEHVVVQLEVEKPIYREMGFTPLKFEIPETLKSKLSVDTKDLRIALFKAEYIASAGSGKMGNTVYFMDVGNKKLSSDFLPFFSLDASPDISYYIDDNKNTRGVDGEAVNMAITRAMHTWDNVSCSEPGITKRNFEPDLPTGFILKFLQDEGLVDPEPAGSYDYVADILHAGWYPSEIFDLLDEDGGDFIIAATFDLVFIDQNGDPVDLDNNGKADSAFREIYYNDGFNFADGDHIDIETVALHEAGHGLGQGHFGKLFQIDRTGKFQFSPRAVMNAGYTGIQTQIGETDEAGHCSNWGSWPKR